MSLPTTALIARLHIRMPGNRHKDNSLTQDVHARHGMAQEAMGFGAFSCSTRHMRQLPATDRRSW